MPNKETTPLGRPLYRTDARPAGPEKHDPAAHAGLWYDKFCNVWQGPSWGKCKIEAARKLAWISSVTGNPVGDVALLSEYAERRRRMADTLGGACVDFTAESRFVTGLGREHPVENGFAWHPTLGTPYLPGSSVKGMIRAWAREEAAPGAANEWEVILGKERQAGRVILLDALPLQPVRLEADVMTPHYSDYYQSIDPDQSPPGDWMSPVPIPFLVVASETRFQFGLIPGTPGDAAYLPVVRVWLCKALEWLGAGAKTAVGYGRFFADGVSEAGQAPAKTSASPAPARAPRYRPGNQVTARRVEDPKGKGRLWFEADDGFGGTLVGGKPGAVPSVEIGNTVNLEIAATLTQGYNFRLPGREMTRTEPISGRKG
jgi:CRISPR-associated protein Cmr6